MNEIFFSNNGAVIKSTDFYTYELSKRTEEDLNLISRKCIHLIRTSNQNESDTAKAMLRMISDEKIFRVNKIANEISLRDQETSRLNNIDSAKRLDITEKTNESIKRATNWMAAAAVITALVTLVQIGMPLAKLIPNSQKRPEPPTKTNLVAPAPLQTH